MKRFLIVISSVLTLLMLTALRDFWLKHLIESRLWEYSGKLAGGIIALVGWSVARDWIVAQTPPEDTLVIDLTPSNGFFRIEAEIQ